MGQKKPSLEAFFPFYFVTRLWVNLGSSPFQVFEYLCSPAGVWHSEVLNPPSPRCCLVISTGWINQYPTVFCSLLNWSPDQTPFKHLPLPGEGPAFTREGPWSMAGVPTSHLERTFGFSCHGSTFETGFFPHQNTTKEPCPVYSEILVVFRENSNKCHLLWC